MEGRPKAKGKAQQRAETLERILDAAEYLFSRHGLDGVTMKQVAERIGVHTSLMSYYFEDKKGLFLSVFERRATFLDRMRDEALDRYEVACDGNPTVEGVLQVFIDSDLDLYTSGGEGWRNWGMLNSMLSNTQGGADLLNRHDPAIRRVVALMSRAMPDLALEDVYRGYQFAAGAMLACLARTTRLESLSDGLCVGSDLVAVKKRMSLFMAGGFRAMSGASSIERQDRPST